MRWLKSFWCLWSVGSLLFLFYLHLPSIEAKIEDGDEVDDKLASLSFTSDVCLEQFLFLMRKYVRSGRSLGFEREEIFETGKEEEVENQLAFSQMKEKVSILSILGSLVGLSMEQITSMLSLAKVGLGVVDILENIFVKVFNGTDLSFNILSKHGDDKKLLAMFEIITLRLEQIQRGIEGTEANLLSLARGLPHMVRWEIAVDTIEDYMKPINNLYHRFSYYQKHKTSIENHTLLDFANSAVSHSTNSVQALMANIHSMIAPSDPPVFRQKYVYDKTEYEVDNRVTSKLSMNLRRYVSSHPSARKEAYKKLQELTLRPSIFLMLEDALENYDKCHYKQSPQQLFFGLYTLLALTLARGYAMIKFSYNILKFHNAGNFTVELQFMDALYMHYSKGLLHNGLQSLQRVSNSYRRCDPLRHEENKTFIMVTELLQGYIENEVDLNSKGSCGSKCSEYSHVEVKGCYLPDKQYCGKHRRCKGQVHDCEFFHADAQVCISEIPYRRYDWVRYGSKRSLGRTGYCENEMTVDSWWRFLYHCSYCVCLCDDKDSPTSDRFISLHPSVSDVVQGMVITGLRFIKKDRVIHIQVQEGLAIPQGQVDPNTLLWADVEPITVGTAKYVDNKDYFTFKYESRNIDLDKLKAPKNHVITGVKFRILGSHINLEIWVTPINFTTGKLNPELSFWISNDNTPVMAENPRKELKLIEPDDPRYSNADSEIDGHSDMFVQLQPTTITADVSQLTVPFFDAQPVAPSPSTWLEGVQMYHRGKKGSGGYIALQVFNYNLTSYFETDNLETEVISK